MLVRRYPGLVALPHVRLADLPTPVSDGSDALRAALGSAEAVGSLVVKHDELTSARYGGNKVRKLEFLLGEALEQERRSVITFGAYGSNHALATAVHAVSLGLETHAILSPQAPGPFAARTLRAHAALGTRLHPIDGWDGSRYAVRLRDELTRRDGVAPAVIPMGGTAPLGVAGYVEAGFELLDQVPDLDAVFVAGGTLGTALGLAVAFAASGSSARVEAVRVTPGEVANMEYAERVVSSAIDLLRAADASFPQLTLADLAFNLRDDLFEPGYGVVTPETSEAVEFASAAGLRLETTYTGKAFSALLRDARAGIIGDEKVVFLNTYSLVPPPEGGSAAALPEVLADYVMTCDAQFARIGDDTSTGAAG